MYGGGCDLKFSLSQRRPGGEMTTEHGNEIRFKFPGRE